MLMGKLPTRTTATQRRHEQHLPAALALGVPHQGAHALHEVAAVALRLKADEIELEERAQELLAPRQLEEEIRRRETVCGGKSPAGTARPSGAASAARFMRW
jgi:hypothetical protein